eukprot:TRINITY_DN25811_c0_g1_i2.p2 TRINITY_DN25811_c0_g1~~TRINITY_DN25811_c0_g1_i2.p2  ORF type:complete len:494 (+),score=110.62 TRINITY_DN25811_c0_g1_i2:66-1547(+)
MAANVAANVSPRHATIPSGKIHVIKVGTSTLLTNDDVGGQKANLSNLSRLVELIASLRRAGDHVVLVSSGAVGMGCLKLGLRERPQGLGAKQAMAAAGQSRLMRLYEDLFQIVGVQVAQLLITRADFSDELRFVHVRSTLLECIRMGIVPIVNENDSLSAKHVQNFGDNDTLAAMTAVLIQADWIFLATDVPFLYSANPKEDPNAAPIYVVDDVAKLKIGGLESSSSQWGTGGMATKLIAARIAVCAGVHCGLVNGSEPERIARLINGDKEGGTHFLAQKSPIVTAEGSSLAGDMHNRWLLTLPTSGSVVLDRKGYKAVLKSRALSLDMLVSVKGEFLEDEAISLFHEGKEVGRALVRLASSEIQAAIKEATTSVTGLRDFTRELEAAGVFLRDYNSWRRGGHKGAKGEINSVQNGGAAQKASRSQAHIAVYAGDVALICATAIKEATAERFGEAGTRESTTLSPSIQQSSAGRKRGCSEPLERSPAQKAQRC